MQKTFAGLTRVGYRSDLLMPFSVARYDYPVRSGCNSLLSEDGANDRTTNLYTLSFRLGVYRVVRDYRGEYFLCLYFLSGTTPAYRPSGPMHTHQGDDECGKNYNTFRVLDGLRSHKLIRLFDRTTDKTQFLWFGHFDAELEDCFTKSIYIQTG